MVSPKCLFLTIFSPCPKISPFTQVPVPEKPSVDDLKLIQEWKWNARKARKLNLERHSQRCDTELKLSVRSLLLLLKIFTCF